MRGRLRLTKSGERVRESKSKRKRVGGKRESMRRTY